jgi:uncharacterized lipoprotein NlpE involved in copper resistance
MKQQITLLMMIIFLILCGCNSDQTEKGELSKQNPTDQIKQSSLSYLEKVFQVGKGFSAEEIRPMVTEEYFLNPRTIYSSLQKLSHSYSPGVGLYLQKAEMIETLVNGSKATVIMKLVLEEKKGGHTSVAERRWQGLLAKDNCTWLVVSDRLEELPVDHEKMIHATANDQTHIEQSVENEELPFDPTGEVGIEDLLKYLDVKLEN